MDSKLLAAPGVRADPLKDASPAVAMPAAAAAPLAVLPALAPAMPPSAKLPARGRGAPVDGLRIGGNDGDGEPEGPIGLADRTPWLAMVAAVPQPALRIGQPAAGKDRREGRGVVERRARARWREAGAGTECSAGMCVCGRCALDAPRI